ncbi:MAG: YbeD family protein [Candidatus Berkiellales bacterium]
MTVGENGKLTFPCQFTFKIIGLANHEFEWEVMKILREHFPQLGEGSTQFKLSTNGKYLAISCNVLAKSQDELDGTYQELSRHPLILFVL